MNKLVLFTTKSPETQYVFNTFHWIKNRNQNISSIKSLIIIELNLFFFYKYVILKISLVHVTYFFDVIVALNLYLYFCDHLSGHI